VAAARAGRDLLWNTRVKDEKGGTVFIRQGDAARYLDENFWTALGVFHLTENLGCLPFAEGWADQPAWITQSLAVLKVEASRVDAEEREKELSDAEAKRKYKK
jgi:hypothetical protein